MRNFIAVFVLACVCGLNGGAQQSSPAPTGSASKSSSAPAKSKKGTQKTEGPAAKPAENSPAKAEEKTQDYSQEAFVIEQLHSRYRFESDGTGRRETIARIRVQSEAGVQQW